jgi:hypothetical protein
MEINYCIWQQNPVRPLDFEFASVEQIDRQNELIQQPSAFIATGNFSPALTQRYMISDYFTVFRLLPSILPN